jgi:transposase
MAYREVAMWEILEVLRRVHGGDSNSAIMRTTGRSRSTVRRYLAAARELGWKPGTTAPTEALAAEIGRRLSPARGRAAGEAEQVLLPHRDQIWAWLKPPPSEKRGLQLTKVHQLLERRGVCVPYSSLHRFAMKHCGLADGAVTVRMAETEPGEVAEIDFGRLGLIWDPATERKRMLWALVVLLVFSRHQYVHTTFSQQVSAVIDGLEDAWHFFGGVTRRLVIDNFAAAVTKADRYDPIFQRTSTSMPGIGASSSTRHRCASRRGSHAWSVVCRMSAKISSAAKSGATATMCRAAPSPGV